MKLRLATPLLALLALGTPLVAQQPQRVAVTAVDYARAEKFLAPNLQGLVVGGAVAPTWLPDERFWYRNQTAGGAPRSWWVADGDGAAKGVSDAIARVQRRTRKFAI